MKEKERENKGGMKVDVFMPNIENWDNELASNIPVTQEMFIPEVEHSKSMYSECIVMKVNFLRLRIFACVSSDD